MGGVIRRDAYFNTVSNHHLDSKFLHPSGKTALNSNVLIAMNFHNSRAQNPGNYTIQLY